MTHASCPLGSEGGAPAPAEHLGPSLTWYWKCGASQLAVLAIGLTSFDQRHPGSNTSRPTGEPPRFTISARPCGNSRVSSGLANVLCSVLWVTAISSSSGPVANRGNLTY